MNTEFKESGGSTKSPFDMSKFSIVNVSDSKWKTIVSNALQYDFYHTQSYHLLEQGEESVLVVSQFEDNFIAFPIIIRAIPDSDYYDCTSVYGYVGPISNMNYNELPHEAIQQFTKGLLSFFKERKVVAAFSRLHPLFPSQELLFTDSDSGKILTLNKTVAIDLNQPDKVQWYNYRKSTRVHIRKALENGITVRRTSEPEDLERFIEIYYENMQRLNANAYYYFSRDYFHHLMEASDFNSELFLAEKEGEIIAGIIVIICNGIMQYHLDGTKDDMLKYSPMKLLFDRARIYANEVGCNYCHLGGGYGGMDDSLFRFKSNFSKDFFDYKVWRKIINKKVYDELVARKFGNKVPSSDYFPLYRY